MSQSVASAASRNGPVERPPTYAVVKFNADDAMVADLYAQLVAAPGRTLKEWAHSEEPLPNLLDWSQLDQNLRISAVFEPVNQAAIQQLRAARGRPAKVFDDNDDATLRPFIRFEIDPFDRQAIGSLEQLKETFAGLDQRTVESVFVGSQVSGPAEGAPMAQPFYLPPVDGGIGVKPIHGTYPGSYGEGTWFVDVEQGWSLPHDELTGRYHPDTISGVNRDWIWSSSARDFVPVGWHGLTMLGLVAANRTGGELTGIAPESFGFLASEWEKLPHTPYTANTAQAIRTAADLLDPGDVILIEGQRYFATLGCNLPVEADPAVFEAILYATSRNITVIEPVGNNFPNGIDLDDFTHPKEPGLFERDSGAILVAAGNNNNTDPTFTSRVESNYGSEVHCFADGDQIWSLDPPDRAGDSLNGYYRVPKGGTSTAAAIIAGVALVLQGIQRAEGSVISAARMRELLSDRDTGRGIEPSGVMNQFGVMPNLQEMEATFGGLTGLGDLPLP